MFKENDMWVLWACLILHAMYHSRQYSFEFINTYVYTYINIYSVWSLKCLCHRHTILSKYLVLLAKNFFVLDCLYAPLFERSWHFFLLFWMLLLCRSSTVICTWTDICRNSLDFDSDVYNRTTTDSWIMSFLPYLSWLISCSCFGRHC